MSPSKIRPAEKPLSMFVSSMMDDDIQPYRDAVEPLIRSRFLTSWAFEYTPASSEPLDEFYLRHVRNADFVIWICGEKTSNPVKREVNEAIIHQKRLLVFRLPADSRDDGTEEVIETISSNQGPKWCDLDDRDVVTFKDALDYTIQDEFTRAIRNDHSWRRIGTLERLNRKSRARVLSRFMASGLSRNQANRMYERVADLPVLASPELPKEGEVGLLVGTLGSGKSFVAERLHQEVLDQSRSPLAPVPFYITARDVRNGLEPHIKQLTPELGDVTSIGASIVIDQVDDLPISDSRRLYEEALALTISWPKTRVLLVSRPLPWIRDGIATTYVREMSLEEVKTVIELVSDSILSQFLWILPDTLRRSVQRPLFAILLAQYLESQEDRTPISMGKLIDWMVQRAVEAAGTDDSSGSIKKLLRSLAVKLTDGSDKVALVDLSTSVTVFSRLYKTHLVYGDSGRIDFALPVLRQWFAFEAIRKQEVSIEDLSSNPERLYRWEDTLTTAVELTTGQVDDIIEPVVVDNVAVASVILDEVYHGQNHSRADSTIPAQEFGQNIRRAMKAFAVGLGPLSQLIAPVTESRVVRPLGVANLANGFYKTSWYEGSASLEGVVDLTSAGEFAISDWPVVLTRTRVESPAWAWFDSKNHLKNQLNERLDSYGIPIRNGYFVHEAAWSLVSAVLDRHSVLDCQFSVDEIRDVLRGEWKCPSHRLRRFNPETIAPVIGFLQKLVDANSVLNSPWPDPDQLPSGSGWVWEFYSPDRLRQRLQHVFSASLEMYQEIVSTWFITMADRLPLYSLLPAYLRVYLHVPTKEDKDYSKEPYIKYYFEPIHDDSLSKAVVYLDSISDPELLEKAQKANQSNSFSTTSAIVDVYGARPATAQAYRWLEDDLSSIKWT